MDGRAFSPTLITDEGVRHVRDIAVADSLRLIDQSDAKILTGLDGRYRFWMTDSRAAKVATESPQTPDGRLYATLRIDAEHGIISGDLFSDIRRTAWICSWHSEAIFAAPEQSPTKRTEWDLLAICDLFRSGSMVGHGDVGAGLPEKLTLLIDTGSGEKIRGLRLIAFDRDGNSALDLSMTDPDGPLRYASFRHLNIVNVTDIKPDDQSIISRVLLHAVGKDGGPLHKVLNETKARLHNSSTESIKLISFDAKSSVGEAAFSMLSPYQWSDDPYGFAVLLTKMPPPKDAVLGTTFGLDGQETLHRPRFGAVVYVQKVIDHYCKMRRIEEQSLSADDIDHIAQRIRSTYIHELGHLLNLPHPWQRDMFRSAALAADPAAQSWMNYGSRYPLGDFMAVLRRRCAQESANQQNKDGAWRLEEELKLAERDSESNIGKALAQPGFTSAERIWLWHAPFDQIASGGQYYTMPVRSPLILSSRNSPQLTLTIWDGRSEGQENAVLQLKKRPGGAILWQPIFGEVEFSTTRDFADRHPFHMTFQSPMLTLLVRCEDTRGEFPDMLAETRRITVPPMPLSWADTNGRPLRDGDLAKTVHHVATLPFNAVKDRLIYRATLPLVADDFLRGFRNDWKDDFTVQAVLRPYDADPIFSNRISISYRKFSGAYSKEEVRIIADPLLPLLVELLHSRTHAKLSDLCPPDPHTDGYLAPALSDLIKAITNAQIGTVSPELLSYCKNRLIWSADGDSIPELRLADFTADAPRLRHFLTSHKEMLSTFAPQTTA